MKTSLDEPYFEWLYAQVFSVKLRNPARTHRNLCRILWDRKFVWFIPNDDNRVEDGRDLRYEFLNEAGVDRGVPGWWFSRPVNMLELLIGISRRAAFETEHSVGAWFWEMLRNLELHEFNDRVVIPVEHVEQILSDLIFRTYDSNGDGGLFPLRRPREDQTDVEIWYQLSAYIYERSRV